VSLADGQELAPARAARRSKSLSCLVVGADDLYAVAPHISSMVGDELPGVVAVS
jgi:hypothetical protein